MKKLVLLSIIIVLMSGVANAVEESIWDTSYNVMKFWLDGNSVTGEYMYDDGVLSGIMDGNIFKGWWREAGNAKECGPGNTWSGPVILRFSDDWKTFTGDWGYCPQQIEDLNINAPSRTWTGTRKDGITDYNQTECQNGGRYWCNGICQIQPCGTDITQEQCENTGKFWCDGICQLTQCDINSGTCSQSELDARYEAGKQYCKDHPSACGISTADGGYTQADLDAAKQECKNNPASCGIDINGSATPATISADLKIHIPQLNYVSTFGTMNLWVDFEYAGESNGSLIWKLTNYGQK